MHKLLIEDDEGKTVAVPLTREEITIGRKEGNTIRLTEQNVSRQHAKFTLRENQLKIEDLGSHNGTKLNGSLLTEPAPLKDGDLILIGDYRLGIQEEIQTESAGAPGTGVPITDVMEGQPTIPVSTMVASIPGLDPPGRLVVTGEVLGGKEFILDRPSLVIGRTPENDVILDHKSISRHHAKVIRDGNRYVIVDLESANGVRVRGIERDRTELRPGDLVELGEVRLRFVIGEEPYADESPSFLSRKRNTILLGVGGVLAIAIVFIVSFSRDEKVPVAEVVPAPALQQPALSAPPPIPPPPPVSIENLLATARQAAEAENWEKALTIVSLASTQEPGSTEAAVLRKTIEFEKESTEKIVQYRQAIEGKNFIAVIEGAKTFPVESRKKPEMDELLKVATNGFIAMHLELATTRASEKQCEEARREAELVLTVAPDNKKAKKVIGQCAVPTKVPSPPAAEKVASSPKVALASPSPKASDRAAAPKVAVTKLPAASPQEAAAANPDQLIKDAQQAWFRGQYAVAIDSARDALKAKPGLVSAYQIIAVCSCALSDSDSAAKAYQKLDDRNKQYVRVSCQKNGINF
jgi:pSer/pThr/pTyr-binding forkhead associated (FHA) protein/tetratricopeptide (TPR) repeat protein